MTDEQVMAYDSYIYYIISKYYGSYPNKEDLFQVGRMGLMDACARYDASQNTKFTTYAFLFIKGKMSAYLQQDRGMKVSREIQKLKLQIDKATLLLSQQLMRMPTITELSCYLNKTEQQIVDAMYSIQSIDEVICQDGKEMTYHDIISDSSIDMDTQIAIKDAFASLPKEEQILLAKRYLEGKTQSEIAEELGINQVQVSRKIKKISHKMYEMVA